MRGDVPSFVSAMTGNLFVVSAPSGAGKSSLVSAVLAGDKRLALSVSFTTRPPRSGEADGREYHFVDGKTFEKMLGRGEFLESAEVHGNRYGTSRKWIGESRAKGLDVVLEIDWQGARQVDFEHDVQPLRTRFADPLARSAVAVSVHLRRFEELAAPEHLLEGLAVDEMVLAPVRLARARRPRGKGDREREPLVLGEHGAHQGRFARAGGRRDDEEVAGHCTHE